MSADTAVPATRRRSLRPLLFAGTLTLVLGLLFGLPWWTIVLSAGWPAPVTAAGTVVAALALLAFPVLMYRGHFRGNDFASRVADTLLGVIWVLFAWSAIGHVLYFALLLGGAGATTAGRAMAVSVLAVSAVLVVWGYAEAMRVPRVKRVDITVPRLGPGLDGTRVVLITDTHYGPIDRAGWSRKVTAAVNELDADIVCHTGDIADGTVAMRLEQAAPLADIRARLARGYVTGNHEYIGRGGQSWLDHMTELGWQSLHNRHTVIERGGDRLVLAGIDDATARSSGSPGHGADIDAALSGADPELPVLLLAHQPKQVTDAVSHGVDLQLSGHTHGGQIWPFHLLVLLDQPALAGLSRHSERTQLYTSRGAGFWGPPLRVFAPSEIALLTLRSGG
ncbi:metallophosphoesterase [Phytomonospora sp. NPDC050363]|uniref:metallophosphoesterase n=1 Tax=Phytomonospora sp. NPDC050363 TaxID=3155642 RepID=UPI0034049DCC